MDKIRQLGVSWESDSLCFVESLETDPEKIFQIPLQQETQATARGNMLNAQENELVRKIKSALKEQKISSSTINLSLPTNDIIFRSFVIPWMLQREVKNVVEFEIGKYIPFSLGELSYSYHPITTIENSKKCICIIFVAIKNDTLTDYVKIFEATSLNVNIIEPSALSLIRTLSFKKLLPEDQTIALIEKENVGKIIVSNKNTPQFVREFQLSDENSEQDSNSPEDATKNLTKEVRISLDYFNRQNEHLKVEKIFFLSSSNEGDLPKSLEDSLEIPVAAINTSSVLSDASQLGIGVLNAYGASIIPFVSALASFNLSRRKPDAKQAPKVPSKKISNHQLLTLTVLICTPLIAGSIAMSILWTQKVKKEISTLKQRLGSFQDSDISFIEQKEELLKKKLANLQQTRTKSDASLFLLLVSDLLPDGTWIKALDISYHDTAEFGKLSANKRQITRLSRSSKIELKPSLTVSLDGYAFSANKGEQFRLVNTLLRNLRSNEEFSKFFQNIELDTISAQKLDGYDVTYFKIICKQTNENIGLK